MGTEYIYQFWAPVYDFFFGSVFKEARKKSIDHLDLQPGEKGKDEEVTVIKFPVIVPGIGTGLDLEFFPDNVDIIGGDLCEKMLEGAKVKAANVSRITLQKMNIEDLQEFADGTFDTAVLHLILSCVPDPNQAFQEVWRVLKEGGRLVIFDKFVGEGQQISTIRSWLGKILYKLGTDPNRTLSSIIGEARATCIVLNEPSLLNGQYRIILMQKQ